MVKKAFSLVEVLITMVIIMVVMGAMVTTMTKKKPKMESLTKRGQYGCWRNESGVLFQQYFDERSPRSGPERINENGGKTCHLQLDESPAHFYIIASGAGCGEQPAQVKTLYAPGLGNSLNISVGSNRSSYSSSCDTTVSSGGSTHEVLARGGGKTLSNGINPLNIKGRSCKLRSARNNCINGGKQESCDFLEKADGEFIARINGCNSQDELGNSNTNNIVYITNMTKTNNNSVVTPSNKTNRIGYQDPNPNKNVYEVNFEFEDSNSEANFDGTPSKMSYILSEIPTRRVSNLTTRLQNLNPGAPKKNGAVIVIW